MGETQPLKLIQGIRKQCLAKSLGGIKGLSTLFRGMDKDFSKAISRKEFVEGMRRFGIQMSEREFHLVFDYFDKDSNGVVDFREFLHQLRPPMTSCRTAVIAEAFAAVDVNKDGLLKVDDLKVVYRKHAERHPKYQSGEWTMDQVLANFLDTFDDPNEKDGMVTQEEFLNYYAGVSSIIEDDEYFDMMIRGCWGLSQSRKSAKLPRK